MSRHDDHRYVIVGAGAIGGTVGGVLARARIRTLLIARGPNAEVLAAAGPFVVGVITASAGGSTPRLRVPRRRGIAMADRRASGNRRSESNR